VAVAIQGELVDHPTLAMEALTVQLLVAQPQVPVVQPTRVVVEVVVLVIKVPITRMVDQAAPVLLLSVIWDLLRVQVAPYHLAQEAQLVGPCKRLQHLEQALFR
jgi:hypothetical protein